MGLEEGIKYVDLYIMAFNFVRLPSNICTQSKGQGLNYFTGEEGASGSSNTQDMMSKGISVIKIWKYFRFED